MCGLIAALQTTASLSEERLAAALRTIAHRGPDHSAVWLSSDRCMALGHARLSIIGVDNGAQRAVPQGLAPERARVRS